VKSAINFSLLPYALFPSIKIAPRSASATKNYPLKTQNYNPLLNRCRSDLTFSFIFVFFESRVTNHEPQNIPVILSKKPSCFGVFVAPFSHELQTMNYELPGFAGINQKRTPHINRTENRHFLVTFFLFSPNFSDFLPFFTIFYPFFKKTCAFDAKYIALSYLGWYFI